jgi:exodeoxyribonuclease VII large subunit
MLMDGNPVLSSVFVRGEISNFTNHYKTGHFYFSLKDEGALVRAVMFRGNASRLRFLPENGMKVILHGRVSVFPRDGQYQIYVDDMQPDGIGSLYVAFEQLKKKLEAEGLFDQSRKRPIPRLPYKIGIVTSPTGAAIRDMINVLGRRFPYAQIVLYPALVQGEGAPAQISEGIKYFNASQSVVVIIVGRGGGSMEDLWAFNDEGLARCVASSEIAIISAVGHETDFTICDFAADLRAPTPSAAAELAVPDTEDIKRRLENVNVRNRATIESRLTRMKQRLDYISKLGVLSTPDRLLDQRRMNVIYLSEKLKNGAVGTLNEEKIKFSGITQKLEALNPLGIISRGYSAVTDAGGKVIRTVSDVSEGDCLNIRFSDGEIKADVRKVIPG